MASLRGWSTPRWRNTYPSIPCDGDYFYVIMQILSEEHSDILTFPTGCGISSVSLSYTYGSRNYSFLEYASSDYISSYTNSLLLRKYPYRRQHLLSRRNTSCPVHHRHMDILYAECPSVESLVFHCNNKCSCFRKSKGNIKKQADIVSRGKSKSTFIRKQLKLTAVFYLKFDKKPMDTYIHGYTASYASGELIFTSSFSSFASTVSIKYTETSIVEKTITSLPFFLW